MQSRFKLSLIIIILLFLFFAIFSLSRFLPIEHSKTFEAMGTFVTIKIKGVNAPKNITLAYNRIKELEKIFNRFDPASEISKINSKLAENTKTKKFSPLIIKLSKDAYNCIALAQNISKLTNGAFDITLTGNYKNMTLNPEDYSIKILKPKIQLNLDGIAKGFAVEEARFLLFKRNVKDGIIDMRSSIAVFDIPKKIGVKNPFEKSGIFETISLNSGQALSTSGTYEQGLHIINPVDKKKVDYWVSITVIGKDAGFLDGLSTGLFVMKKDEAVKLVKSLNLGAILITKDKKVFKVNI